MTSEDIERLRTYTDEVVNLHTVDGENLIAKIVLMQDEYEDFIYELISSDQEHRYINRGSCYVAPYEAIASFELAEKES